MPEATTNEQASTVTYTTHSKLLFVVKRCVIDGGNNNDDNEDGDNRTRPIGVWVVEPYH
jgi:hypothetical protein